MTEKTVAGHMLQQHQAEVMAGFAADVNWSQMVEDSSEAVFDAIACERIAAAAPTEYLAGFWFARALARRETQALTDLRED